MGQSYAERTPRGRLGIMSVKSIAVSTLWQVASQVVMAALSIITIKFVAVGLSKELAGNYHSAYGFLQLFGILADFGLYAVAVREVSRAEKTKRPEIMGALMILRSVILCLSLGSALLFAWILPAWRGTPLPLGVTIAALVPFFTLLAGMQRTIFQVSYKMQYVFVAEVTQRIITVLLIGTIIALGARASTSTFVYQSFLAAGGVGAAVLCVLSSVLGRPIIPMRFTWNPALLRELFLRSAPYGIAFFCTALYRQIDVTLIALLRPDYDLQNAYYGFALRAVEMAYLFPTFLLNSTLPLLSARAERGEDTRTFVGTVLFAILLLGSTAAIFAASWAKPIMRLLTTEAYLSSSAGPGSDTALALLAPSMFLNGIVLFSFYTLLTLHRWRPLVWTLACGALISLALNGILIPSHGFVGAAWTSIATHLLLAACLLPLALRTLPAHFGIVRTGQWVGYCILLASGLVLSAPLLTSNSTTVAALLLAGFVVAGIAFLLRIPRSMGLGGA